MNRSRVKTPHPGPPQSHGGAAVQPRRPAVHAARVDPYREVVHVTVTAQQNAGWIAVTAGGLFAAAHLGMFLVGDPSELVAMMTDPLFLSSTAAYAITFPLLLIALVALYWRQAREVGVFGAVAFCTAITGTVALAGDMWFEGFAVPWLAQVAPAVFDADRTGLLMSAWLVSAVLFSLGWVLFGLASLRGRTLPRTLAVVVAVGGLLGFKAATPPWGVALGLAVAAVGAWIIRHEHALRSVHAHPVHIPATAARAR